MDEVERTEDPSLPPGYVSLAQLQERWIKKQQEKKLKEKEEEEKKERNARTQNQNQSQRGFKNDAREKIAGLSLNDAPRRRVGKNGRQMGVIEVERKGKEILLVENKRNHKRREKKKSAEDGENENELKNEKLRSEMKEIDAGDGCEGVEIVNKNELKVGFENVLSGENSGRGGNYGGFKGIDETISVAMMEVLPDVKTVDFRGGFRRNVNNRGSRYNNSEKQYRVRVNNSKETEVELAMGKKMEDEKGYVKKWRERRRNGESCYRFKESRVDVLKDNELEPESENKAEDEISEVCNEIDGLNVIDGVEGEGLSDNSLAMEKKVDNGVFLGVESVKNVGNRYRRYGNWRGNNVRKFSGVTSYDWKAGNMRSRMEASVGDGRRYARFGRCEGYLKIKQRESSVMWVKKEDKSGGDAAEAGSSGISEDQA